MDTYDKKFLKKFLIIFGIILGIVVIFVILGAILNVLFGGVTTFIIMFFFRCCSHRVFYDCYDE